MSDSDVAAQIRHHRYRFPGVHLSMVMDSIVAGNTGGQLWEIPQASAEPLVLLWEQGNNGIYLAGECEGDTTTAAGVLAGQVFPRIRERGAHFVKACPLSQSLERALPRLLPDLALRPSVYLFFVHDPARGPGTALTPFAGITYLPITSETLAAGRNGGSEAVREEVESMWPSEDRFFRDGFGVMAVQEREIVCWCTAEFVGRAYCGVGIATRPDQQRRGIATGTAARFVQEAHRRGLIPCWECARDNIPSVRVAEKVGFVLEHEETYWIGRSTEASS